MCGVEGGESRDTSTSRDQKGKRTGVAKMAGIRREELNGDRSHLFSVRDLTGRTRGSRSSLTTQVLKPLCTLSETASRHMHVSVCTSVFHGHLPCAGS